MPAGRQPEGDHIMANWEFTAAGPIRADISLPAGSVHVTTAQTDKVTLSLSASSSAGERLLANTEVSFEDNTLRVRAPKRSSIFGNVSLDLHLELPEGSSVTADTASADVTLDGQFGGVHGKTASGGLRVYRVDGDAELTTASGHVRLEDATGDARLTTASGDVIVNRADGDIIAKTASGDVWIGRAGQSVTAKTASGDVRIDSIDSGLADATTVSGDITLAVAPGIGIYMDISTLSGDVSSELDADESVAAEGEAVLTVSCRSVSGDVRIVRSTAANR
jgi:DUF4097 and DUF4098 domain-containing protein YvlB